MLYDCGNFSGAHPAYDFCWAYILEAPNMRGNVLSKCNPQSQVED